MQFFKIRINGQPQAGDFSLAEIARYFGNRLNDVEIIGIVGTGRYTPIRAAQPIPAIER